MAATHPAASAAAASNCFCTVGSGALPSSTTCTVREREGEGEAEAGSCTDGGAGPPLHPPPLIPSLVCALPSPALQPPPPLAHLTCAPSLMATLMPCSTRGRPFCSVSLREGGGIHTSTNEHMGRGYSEPGLFQQSGQTTGTGTHPYSTPLPHTSPHLDTTARRGLPPGCTLVSKGRPTSLNRAVLQACRRGRGGRGWGAKWEADPSSPARQPRGSALGVGGAGYSIVCAL